MSFTSSKSCWVFDVDGVLADTREAVYEAYRLAGVDQPDYAWGIAWQLWLPSLVGDRAAEVHATKQYEYARLLARGAAERLPGADMAETLGDAGHRIHYVTAASEPSALAVINWLMLDTADLYAAELSRSQRVSALEYIVKDQTARTYTYVDDREEGASIARETGYGFVHARWTQ